MIKQLIKILFAVLLTFLLMNCEKPDTMPPELKLLGDDTMYVVLNKSFEDPGATAKDNRDGDLNQNILITSELNTNETGTYKIYYTVTDDDGNKAETVRYVIVYNQAEKYTGSYLAEITNLQSGDLISYNDLLYPSKERNHFLHTENFMDDSTEISIYMNPDTAFIEQQQIIYQQDTLFVETPNPGHADSLSIELDFNLLQTDSTLHSQYELNYQRVTPL